MREITVAAAQLGPIQKAESREEVVARLIKLMEEAASQGADLVVYPELALTTFFPRWYMEDQTEVDTWFEKEMPSAATRPLFDCAKKLGVSFYLGYAELTEDGHHFNTAVLVDKQGEIVGKYRKTHLPGHSEYDTERAFQHLEKRYFEPGDTGFKVFKNLAAWMGMAICNDRRWPETWRCMGLQGVEMVMVGYNTPAVNAQMSDEGKEKRLYHSELSITAAAYQNATWAVAVAKAGNEDGFPLMAGSIIVDPNGFVVARAKTEDDEVVIAKCDLDECTFGKETIFDFKRHRRIEHYGIISSQTGAITPDGEKI